MAEQMISAKTFHLFLFWSNFTFPYWIAFSIFAYETIAKIFRHHIKNKYRWKGLIWYTCDWYQLDKVSCQTKMFM